MNIKHLQELWCLLITTPPVVGLYSDESRQKELKAWKHRMNQIANAQHLSLSQITGEGYCLASDKRTIVRKEDGSVIKECASTSVAAQVLQTLEDESL